MSEKYKKGKKHLRSLVEAIILQAIEDLWSDAHRKESIKFFMGEAFKNCARIANMNLFQQLRLIRMIRRASGTSGIVPTADLNPTRIQLLRL
ncbi:MAG: hypothetical protein AB1638_06690 [Nitrospirota bacterium]